MFGHCPHFSSCGAKHVAAMGNQYTKCGHSKRGKDEGGPTARDQVRQTESRKSFGFDL